MSIRTRLAIRFTIIVASLLIIFATAIYYFSSSYRKREFYERLNEKANNYVSLLKKVDKQNPDLIKIFDRNTAYLPKEKIIVYDSKNKMLFNTVENSVGVRADFLNKVRTEKEIRYLEGQNEVLALFNSNNIETFVVIVSAFDKDGLNKLDNLKIILLFGLVFCVIATTIAGWVYAGQALDPISGVVKQVEKISVSNLTQRVDEGRGKDEIEQLAMTFNDMLGRIQKSFELQKSFVSNSSHELRTPLTSITGQLEVALMSEKDSEEYKVVLNSILDDIKSLNRLTNGLLELAHADIDISKLKMQKERVDELLLITRNDVLKRNSEYKVNVEGIEFPEDENKLIIMGSQHLLCSAFGNIIENACKFSENKEVKIFIDYRSDEVEICFLDNGIGISDSDIQKISQPFYRGANAKAYPGHGLGLSLTSKIMDLHKGKMKIESNENEFTKVTVCFQLVKLPSVQFEL